MLLATVSATCSFVMTPRTRLAPGYPVRGITNATCACLRRILAITSKMAASSRTTVKLRRAKSPSFTSALAAPTARRRYCAAWPRSCWRNFRELVPSCAAWRPARSRDGRYGAQEQRAGYFLGFRLPSASFSLARTLAR